MVLGDVNGDTNLDVAIVTHDSVSTTFTVLTGKGTWHFAVGDVNGHGKVDVITTNTESNTVGLLLGR